MNQLLLTSHDIACPYCGETINIDVDHSQEHQQYVEDCQVCCQPIVITVSVSVDEPVPLIHCDVENP